MAIMFDGPSKMMTLTTGTVSVSVRELWSRWVDWFLTSDNSKYLPAFQSIGGDEIDPTAGTAIPIYAFLTNGWRIKPQEADHTLVVDDGILVVNGGGDPFTDTDGSYVVRINYQQPVQAITVATGGSSAPSVQEIINGIFSNSVESGYTFAQVMKILSSVLAGKTTIDVGPPVVVTFRDIGDETDRVTATMSGSERVEITLNTS